MASHIWTKKDGTIYVRWRDPDRSQKLRKFSSRRAAEKFQRALEEALEQGKAWTPPDSRPVPPLFDWRVRREADGTERIEFHGGIFRGFLVAKARKYAENTLRLRTACLWRFAQWLARRAGVKVALASHLTQSALSDYWAHLVGELDEDDEPVRGISASRNEVISVQLAWAWAWASDEFCDLVPRPRRLEDMPETPTRVVVAPSWAEMDAVYWAAVRKRDASRDDHPTWVRGATWRVDLIALLRYTGLRAGQVMRLRWSDLDLEAGRLRIRPELGKSKRERNGREIAISWHLVRYLEAMRTDRRGYIVAPWRKLRRVPTDRINELWAASGVAEVVWKGRPDHCFRSGLTSGLKRAGADVEAAEHLVGHATAGPKARQAYLDYDALPTRDAVELMPAIAPLQILPLRTAAAGSPTPEIEDTGGRRPTRRLVVAGGK